MSETGAGDSGQAGALLRLPPPLPTVLVAGWPPYPADTAARLSRRAGLRFTWQREADGGWETAGEGLSYTPGEGDVGRRLRLVGRRAGEEAEEICQEAGPVLAGPGPCPAERGHRLTAEPLGADGFRLVTYNLLADYYVQYSRGLGVMYCPAEVYHDIEYRKQGLMLQLLGYHADVLCLQEVDHCLFDSYWLPMLEAAGFGGAFAVKTLPVRDGVATFWSDKFRLVSTERQVIAELAVSPDGPSEEVRRVLEGNAELKGALTELPQVLQVTVLEETEHSGRPARRLLVANVHLYWNRNTEHLRAIQVGVCLGHIQRKMEALAAEEGAGDITLVFSGDFNSQLHQSVCRLMTTGTMTVQDFNTCEGQAVPDVTFSHPYHLGSAYGAPEVTSSTTEFTGTLDHIFYMQDKLKLTQVVPLPTPEEVRAASSLPTAEFPSDHLALTADFQWLD